MGESLGQLKVTVVQGKRLVIRDFKSSDPYVLLKLGNQVFFGLIFLLVMAKDLLNLLVFFHMFTALAFVPHLLDLLAANTCFSN